MYLFYWKERTCSPLGPHASTMQDDVCFTDTPWVIEVGMVVL